MLNLIRNLLRPGERLSHRAFSAGAWAFGLRIAMRVLVLARTVVLARLLVPEDFGLMAIATLVLLLFDRLTQPGFDAALVQRGGDIREYLDTAWTFQVARSTAIAAVLLLTAPAIAGFFNAPEAESILRVLSIAVLIKGLASVGIVDIWRELRFDRYFLIEISAPVADVIVSITAALILRNVWALVLGVLAGAVLRTASSYLLHPYRPRFRWNRVQAGEMFRFGKWVMATNILGYTSVNLDDILVGRLLGVTSLGFYRMAYNFSQAVSSEFSAITSQVAFPTYSRLQSDDDRRRAAYMGTLHLVAFLAFPVAVGTALVASDLVIGLLGAKWAPIIPALQLLCIAGLARALSGTAIPLFEAGGKPHIGAILAGVELAVLAILLVPAIDYAGIEGAAGAVATTGAFLGVASLLMAFRYVGGTLADASQTLLIPAINTGIMTLAVLGTMSLLPNRPTALSFVILAAVGAAAYFASVWITVRSGLYTAPKDLTTRLGELRQ